jgi:hypothetical protein
VEILGHIFEQSIDDLEQLYQEIAMGGRGRGCLPFPRYSRPCKRSLPTT